MSLEDIIEQLDGHNEVLESYVLLREIKAYLNLGKYQPQINIKISLLSR